MIEARFAPDSPVEGRWIRTPSPTVGKRPCAGAIAGCPSRRINEVLISWDREFADSPLEEAGFELSVPREIRSDAVGIF
jgi:hypothetical protein